jgi:hypothetical protein
MPGAASWRYAVDVRPHIARARPSGARSRSTRPGQNPLARVSDDVQFWPAFLTKTAAPRSPGLATAMSPLSFEATVG